MKKITLMLIALITVGCSDPKDEYIALECSIPLAMGSENGSFDLIMDDNSRTFSWYIDNGDSIDEIHSEFDNTLLGWLGCRSFCSKILEQNHFCCTLAANDALFHTLSEE